MKGCGVVVDLGIRGEHAAALSRYQKRAYRALRRETFRGPSEDYGLATDALRLLELRKK